MDMKKVMTALAFLGAWAVSAPSQASLVGDEITCVTCGQTAITTGVPHDFTFAVSTPSGAAGTLGFTFSDAAGLTGLMIAYDGSAIDLGAGIDFSFTGIDWNGLFDIANAVFLSSDIQITNGKFGRDTLDFTIGGIILQGSPTEPKNSLVLLTPTHGSVPTPEPSALGLAALGLLGLGVAGRRRKTA